MRKQGFISYIHEEEQLAEYIKSWCNQAFLGQLDLFVSSLDMQPGGWLAQLRRSLRRSSFVFPLLSQCSMGRPWINFESGSAFMASGVELIPLCHKDITPSDLANPYSAVQAYDLREPTSVMALIQYLSGELDLDVPRVDVNTFSREIIRLDSILYRFFHSFEELKDAAELRDSLMNVDSPIEIPINDIDLWDELELRVRVHNNRVVELSGYTRDAMGFNVHNIEVPEGCQYLLVKVENVENAISHDQDKLLKVVLDRQNVKARIDGHGHFDDSQFTVKGDGFFVFELPLSVKNTGKIKSASFVFWRIELQRLLMRFYLA